MTLSDSKIFNNTQHPAASLQQLVMTSTFSDMQEVEAATVSVFATRKHFLH